MGQKKVAQNAATQAAQSMPNQPPGGSVPCRLKASISNQPPMFPEEAIICAAICACDASGTRLKQICVTKTLWGGDDAAGNLSTIKAEVPYDMSQRPPTPIMSRNNPKRATRRKPAGSRIPDVVIVNDPTKPPAQNNLRMVVEIKFPPDDYSEGQREDYAKIAGDDADLVTLGPEECGCKKRRPQEQPVPVPVPVPKEEPKSVPVSIPPLPKPGALEVTLLTLGLIGLVLDDLLPTGATQADDVAIPAILGRLLMAF